MMGCIRGFRERVSCVEANAAQTGCRTDLDSRSASRPRAGSNLWKCGRLRFAKLIAKGPTILQHILSGHPQIGWRSADRMDGDPRVSAPKLALRRQARIRDPRIDRPKGSDDVSA